MANMEEETIKVDPRVEREKHVVESRKGLGTMPDKLVDDFGFAMKRLHDPSNYDHTTIESAVAAYHFRDLEKSKIFRIAKKIFGDKMDSKFRIRTRAFNLTGLKQGCPVVTGSNVKREKQLMYQCSSDKEPVEEEDEDLVDMNDLRLRKKPSTDPANGENLLGPAANVEDYKNWLEERKQLRANINSLGLNESWLRNKSDKTEMETLLYQQLMSQKHAIFAEEQAIAKEKERLAAGRHKSAESLPRIRRPSPIAIRKLDAFLKSNKLRLIDIFSAIDKDKNWHLSREEFKSAVELLLERTNQQYGMDISPVLLEDLITTLDVDRNGEVSYKELVKGLELYQREKRDVMNKGLTMPQDDEPEEDEVDGEHSSSSTPHRSAVSSRHASGKALSDSLSKPASASNRRPSRGSSATTLLATPEPDLQESKLVLKSQESQVDLRKRDKSFLKFYNKHERHQWANNTGNPRTGSPTPPRSQSKITVFKTGYKPVDDHCKPSRLEGETGAMVNSFRQLKLKEYHRIIKLCETEGVALSRKLLDKVLLHPGDKTSKMMLKQGIRQPGASFPLSKHFAEPPKRPRTPIEIRNKGKIMRGRDGKLLIDYKHRFPSQANSAPVPTKVQLSTGKALISRKVDCWMTFEEYEAMTKDFYAKRYVQMEPNGDKKELTWPGYMLDKMRIYLDRDRTADPSNALFHEVKHAPKSYHGYDNDLNNWQISDAGYLKQGAPRNPKKYYDISNLQPDISYRKHTVNDTAGLTMHTKHTQLAYHS